MVRFAKLCEFVLFSGGFLLIVFQIIVPGLTGTPFFPLLRSKPRKAVHDLTVAVEEKNVADIQEKTHEIWPGDVSPTVPKSDATKQRKGK